MTKLVIFDLDGTLLDTREDIANACNYALRMCGCPERSIEEYNMIVGKGIMNLFRGALPEDRRNEETVLKMKDFFVPYYNEHLADFTKPYEGIEDMLDAMAKAGISMAVASNKYQEGTELLVRNTLGRYEFKCIFGQREGKPLKPDPTIIYDILESIPGSEASETIYFGDSDIDMQTGAKAGIRTVGVAWGFRSREELSAHKPWLLVENPEEITHIIIQDNK